MAEVDKCAASDCDNDSTLIVQVRYIASQHGLDGQPQFDTESWLSCWPCFTVTRSQLGPVESATILSRDPFGTHSKG